MLYCRMKTPTNSLLLCLLTASLVGCSGATVESDNLTDAAASSAESAGLAYPALYRDMGLPELPGGQVVSTGRQETSLRDGLSLRVTTSIPVSEVRDYYSSALADLGWEETPSRVLPGLPVAGLQATRDGVNYTATITDIGEETRIDISVIEQ